jgi:hypothetical protein
MFGIEANPRQECTSKGMAISAIVHAMDAWSLADNFRNRDARV